MENVYLINCRDRRFNNRRFWGIPKYDEEMSDLKGTSVVLVNNKKAEEFLKN